MPSRDYIPPTITFSSAITHTQQHTHTHTRMHARARTHTHLFNRKIFKWLVSQWPYLVHHHPIAPHITLCGVLTVQNGLGSCPAERETSSTNMVVVVTYITRHAKIGNLHQKWAPSTCTKELHTKTISHTHTHQNIYTHLTSDIINFIWRTSFNVLKL